MSGAGFGPRPIGIGRDFFGSSRKETMPAMPVQIIDNVKAYDFLEMKGKVEITGDVGSQSEICIEPNHKGEVELTIKGKIGERVRIYCEGDVTLMAQADKHLLVKSKGHVKTQYVDNHGSIHGKKSVEIAGGGYYITAQTEGLFKTGFLGGNCEVMAHESDIGLMGKDCKVRTAFTDAEEFLAEQNALTVKAITESIADMTKTLPLAAVPQSKKTEPKREEEIVQYDTEFKGPGIYRVPGGWHEIL